MLVRIEGLKTFDAKKIMFDIRSVSSSVKKEFYESVVVSTMTFGTEGIRDTS